MERLVIDSVNYDYVPGEPESRRVWFITLRQPPYDIKPGMIVRVDSYKAENLPINTDVAYYRVNDIYGTHVVVDPIQIVPKNSSEINNSSRNSGKTSNNNRSENAGKVLDGLSGGYARAGFYTYAQRPQTQRQPLSFFDIL
jgi:hypothetical protein